jgi:hypothetical protein
MGVSFPAVADHRPIDWLAGLSFETNLLTIPHDGREGRRAKHP